jgi:hypothetical protein
MRYYGGQKIKVLVFFIKKFIFQFIFYPKQRFYNVYLFLKKIPVNYRISGSDESCVLP